MPTPLLQEGEFERTIRISYALQEETVAEEQGHRDESSSAHKSGRRNPEDELTRSRIVQKTEVPADKLIRPNRDNNEWINAIRHLSADNIKALRGIEFVVPALEKHNPNSPFLPSNGGENSGTSAFDEVCILFMEIEDDTKLSPTAYCDQVHVLRSAIYLSSGNPVDRLKNLPFPWDKLFGIFGHFATLSPSRHTESDDHVTRQALDFVQMCNYVLMHYDDRCYHLAMQISATASTAANKSFTASSVVSRKLSGKLLPDIKINSRSPSPSSENSFNASLDRYSTPTYKKAPLHPFQRSRAR